MYLVDVMRDAAHEVGAVVRARSPTHGHLRDRVVAILVFTIGVDLLCAVLALLFERHQPQTQVTSFGSALFWTSTQLLTVSSSVQNPISAAGRVLDVGMEAYALTGGHALAGSLGALLAK